MHVISLCFSDLLLHWKDLKNRVNKMEEYRRLQWEMLQLKNDLSSVKIPVPLEGLEINYIEDLSRDIDFHSVSTHVFSRSRFIVNRNN